MGELQYTLIRSRRRTITLIVADGSVTVRAPQRMPEQTIRQFVLSKRGWIEKQLARHDGRFDVVREGKAVLLDGALYPLCVGADRNAFSDGCFYIKDMTSLRPFFMRRYGDALLREAQAMAVSGGFSPSRILLRDFKSRWGSCDAAGCIKLNWRLILLPPALRQYVLWHELCHLKQLNHSAAFWKEVSRLCPQWRACRAELKNYAFLTSLYRR